MAQPKISPRSFGDGAVGLRIVAAMSDSGPKRSEPIPIKRRVGPTLNFEEKEDEMDEEQEEGDDDVELSESYTCVIVHVGGGRVRKREYLGGGGGDDDVAGGGGIGCNFGVSSGVFLESPEVGSTFGGFLSCCFLCTKKLLGIDIFMYRGEAFCSVDCRYQQILNDDYKKKCRSGAAKARESFVYRASLIFDAGVAAA